MKIKFQFTKFQSNSFWILNWKIGNYYTNMKLFPELARCINPYCLLYIELELYIPTN